MKKIIFFFLTSSCSLFILQPTKVLIYQPIYKIVSTLSKFVPIDKQERSDTRKFYSKYFRIVQKDAKILFLEIFPHNPKPSIRYKLKFSVSGDSNPYTLFINIFKEKRYLRNGIVAYQAIDVSDQLKSVVKETLTSQLGKRSKIFNVIDDFRIF